MPPDNELSHNLQHTHTLKLVAVSSHESLLGFIPAVTRQSSPQESQDDPDALCSAGKRH